jgi:DNA polymerase sigma
VKNFEYKLDSVRKEREAAIAIIDRCVKHVFERPHASSRAPIIPVSIKQYGSQASHLAVDSSDVDLAVTGLKLNGDQDLQIYEMRRLHHYFEEVRSEGYIVKLDLIETASVPLIKVQIDLQVI